MPLRNVLALSLVLAFSATAAAAPSDIEGSALVAVMLDAKDSTLNEKESKLIEEAIRSSASNELTPLGYTVLTGETTVSVLADNGIDARKACDTTCVLDTARQINARLFVSGSLTTVEGVHTGFMRLFDSVSGKVLASTPIEGVKVLEIKRSIEAKGKEIFAPSKVPSVKGKGRQGGRTVTGRDEKLTTEDTDFNVDEEEQKVFVDFDSTPAKAAVLLDGRILCTSTPCRRTVPVGTHDVAMQLDRYEDATTRILLQGGKDEKVNLTLPPTFAVLNVETTPAGITVNIEGKGAMKTPVRNLEMRPSQVLVEIDDPCWAKAGEKALLRKGETRSLKLEAAERLSAIEVVATDADDNELKAEVKVDGNSLGYTPRTFKIPLCSKEVVVLAEGKTWRSPLRDLREKSKTTVNAVIGNASAYLDITAVDDEGNDLRADVKVDGTPMGTTPQKFKVPMASSKVEITASEHETFTESLSLQAKEVKELRANLRAKFGFVTVTATDEDGSSVDADVYVNGSKVGRTGEQIKVSTSSTRVSVSTDDKEWSDSFSLSPRQKKEFSAVLRAKYRYKDKDDFVIEGVSRGRDVASVVVGKEAPIVAAPAQLLGGGTGGTPVQLPTDNPSGLAVRGRIEIDKRAADDDFRLAAVGNASYTSYLGEQLSDLSYLTDDFTVHMGVGELDEVNWTVSMRHHRTDKLENPAVPLGAMPGGWNWKIGMALPLDDDGGLSLSATADYESHTLEPRLAQTETSGDEPVWNAACQQIGLCNKAALYPYQWGTTRLHAGAAYGLSRSMRLKASYSRLSHTFDKLSQYALTGLYSEAVENRMMGKLEFDPMRSLSIDVEAGQQTLVTQSLSGLGVTAPDAAIIGRAYAKFRPLSYISIGAGAERSRNLVGGFEQFANATVFTADAAARIGSALSVRASGSSGDYEYATGRKDNIVSLSAEARFLVTDELVVVASARKMKRGTENLRLPSTVGAGEGAGGVGSPVAYPTNGYNFDQLGYFAGAEYLF